MSDTPTYDALVIEREGHPTDDDIAAALAAWQLGDPLPHGEHDDERMQP